MFVVCFIPFVSVSEKVLIQVLNNFKLQSIITRLCFCQKFFNTGCTYLH